MSKKYRLTGNYQLTSHIAVVLVVLVVFLSVGYFFFLGRPHEQALHIDMTDHLVSSKALWQKRRPASYRYVVDRACNCPDEDDRAYTVTVTNGRPSAHFPIPVESSTGTLITEPPRPLWLDDVFEVVEKALRAGGDIEVRYDPSWGFPRSVIVGPAEQYEIRDFEVIASR